MASRSLLRFGASAAVRSARGHRLPAGQIWPPLWAPHTGAGHRFADPGSVAGFFPAVQGRHHCTTPSNPRTKAELEEAVRNIERRLDALEEERDHGHNPFIKENSNNHMKEKLGSSDLTEEGDEVIKVVKAMCYTATFGVILYKFCS